MDNQECHGTDNTQQGMTCGVCAEQCCDAAKDDDCRGPRTIERSGREHRTGRNPSDACNEQDAEGHCNVGQVGRIGQINPVDGRTGERDGDHRDHQHGAEESVDSGGLRRG